MQDRTRRVIVFNTILAFGVDWVLADPTLQRPHVQIFLSKVRQEHNSFVRFLHACINRRKGSLFDVNASIQLMQHVHEYAESRFVICVIEV